MLDFTDNPTFAPDTTPDADLPYAPTLAPAPSSAARRTMPSPGLLLDDEGPPTVRSADWDAVPSTLRP